VATGTTVAQRLHNGHNGQGRNPLMNDLKIPENGIQMMYQLVVAVEIIHNATR